jgi:elongation factor Tu
MVEMVEEEIKDLLNKYNFPGDTTPFIVLAQHLKH